MSCYEAGRDSFWLHRYLLSKDIGNLVVDSASIEVNPFDRLRAGAGKRAKTDRLDMAKLLTMLVRYDYGEKKVWSVVHVPSPEAEDKRHLHRQLMTRKVDRTRHINRIKRLLVGQGVRLPVGKEGYARKSSYKIPERGFIWQNARINPPFGVLWGKSQDNGRAELQSTLLSALTDHFVGDDSLARLTDKSPTTAHSNISGRFRCR